VTTDVPASRTAALRLLDGRDRDPLFELLGRDPVANVFVTARVTDAGFDPWRLGGELWGYVVDGRLEAACYAGANLVPVTGNADAMRAFADRARRQGRRCSSIVGPSEQVHDLWSQLDAGWGPARDFREAQPLMSVAGAPQVAPDPGVQVVRLDQLDVLMPACVAMFTEEVGVSPVSAEGDGVYRGRVRELVSSRRAFARIEDDRVLFKAEVGAVSSSACQVQGVWVDPDLRGRGLGAAGMAAVVEQCLADVAPVVSLYVNDYNVAALATYRRVGFRQVGTFSTVLF
jgi:predicted GNAT family acetyltransferase